MVYMLSVFAVLFVVIFFCRYVIGIFRVNQDSMIPTFNDGDFVLTNNWTALRFRLTGRVPVKVGDIVVAKIYDKHLIKRVASASVRGVFLKGDNYVASIDSRSFGEILYKDIVGVVFLTIRGK